MKQSFDITEHILVPKHTKLSKKDKDQLLKKYNISLKNLPFIQIDDPGLRNLQVRVGDVVKIMRSSITAGEAISYRVVVSQKDESFEEQLVPEGEEEMDEETEDEDDDDEE